MEAQVQRPSVHLLSRSDYWINRTQPFLQSRGVDATRIELAQALALPERSGTKLIMRVAGTQDPLLSELRLIVSRALVLVVAGKEYNDVGFEAGLYGAHSVDETLETPEKMITWIHNRKEFLEAQIREQQHRRQQRGY